MVSFEVASFTSNNSTANINSNTEHDWAPRKKQVVATIDGQLLVLNVHEPHRSVLRSNMEILQAASASFNSPKSSIDNMMKGDGYL